TNEIDVSTYRKGRIQIIDTARDQKDLYELDNTDHIIHTRWDEFKNQGTTDDPDWVWLYDGSKDGRQVDSKALGDNGTQFSYQPAKGQMMVWVMGWNAGETTTTVYTTKNFNLIGENVDPLGWLTDKDTTKKGPTTVLEAPLPVLVSTVVAYVDADSIPSVVKDRLSTDEIA